MNKPDTEGRKTQDPIKLVWTEDTLSNKQGVALWTGCLNGERIAAVQGATKHNTFHRGVVYLSWKEKVSDQPTLEDAQRWAEIQVQSFLNLYGLSYTAEVEQEPVAPIETGTFKPIGCPGLSALDGYQVEAFPPPPVQQGEEQGWQPIETVPRRGTLVDLWAQTYTLVSRDSDEMRPAVGFRVPNAQWFDGQWCDENGSLHGYLDGWGDVTLTHWRPCPAAPALLPKQDEGRRP